MVFWFFFWYLGKNKANKTKIGKIGPFLSMIGQNQFSLTRINIAHFLVKNGQIFTADGDFFLANFNNFEISAWKGRSGVIFIHINNLWRMLFNIPLLFLHEDKLQKFRLWHWCHGSFFHHQQHSSKHLKRNGNTARLIEF